MVDLMRITLINQFYRPDISPTAHLSASLATHRAAGGDDVTVVTSRGGYVPASADAAEAERHANPRVYRVWTPRLGKAAVWKRCVDYLSFYLGAAWRLIRLPAQDVIVSLTTPPFIAPYQQPNPFFGSGNAFAPPRRLYLGVGVTF